MAVGGLAGGWRVVSGGLSLRLLVGGSYWLRRLVSEAWWLPPTVARSGGI